MNFLDVNTVNLRNIYGTALGNTTGQVGTSANQTAMPVTGGMNAGAVPTNQGDAAQSQALTVGGQANPVIGAVVFLALIVGLGFLAKRIGSVDDFKNIKVSPFNVLIISLAAIIGMPIWKWTFTRFPVPGVSTWVASA